MEAEGNASEGKDRGDSAANTKPPAFQAKRNATTAVAGDFAPNRRFSQCIVMITVLSVSVFLNLRNLRNRRIWFGSARQLIPNIRLTDAGFPANTHRRGHVAVKRLLVGANENLLIAIGLGALDHHRTQGVE